MTPATARVGLFIDPPSHHFLGDRLFDSERAAYGGDDLMAPYRCLRDWFQARGVPVHTADRLEEGAASDVNVYLSLGMLDKYRRIAARPDVVASAFFAMECPIVEPSMYRHLPAAATVFRRVYSWTDSETLRRFTRAPVPVQRFWWPQSFDGVHEALWSRQDRRLLVMINANKLPRVYWQELYTERLRAVAFFSERGEVDLYGKGWDGPSHRVGRTWVPYTAKRVYLAGRRALDRVRPDPLLAAVRRAWRGATASKSETLSQYRFALCFENARIKGWVTEKIFDCFFAGTVPVYWGAPDIEDVIPPEAFIDMRRFAGYGELREYLLSLSQSEVQRLRDAARAFVGSPAYQRFSRQAFTDIVRGFVEADTGLPLPNHEGVSVTADGGPKGRMPHAQSRLRHG